MVKRCKTTLTGISLLFFLAFTAPGFTQTQCAQSAEVVTLLLTYAPGEDDNSGQKKPGFRKIVTDSLQFELERIGLKVILGTVLESAGESPPEIEQVLGSAERPAADFAVTELCSFNNDQFQIDLSLYDVEQGKLIASVSKKGPIGLKSDAVIAAAVKEMLTQAGERLQQALAAAATTTATVESEETTITDPVSETVGKVVAMEPQVKVQPASRVRRFEFAAGFAPFLTVGKASDYFDLGYFPSLYGSFRFNVGAGLLGVGLYSGVNLFQASGRLTSSQVKLLPIGLDLRFVVGEDRLLGVFVHVNGGAALLIMSAEQSVTLAKALPYVQGGLGLVLSLAPVMGLVLDMSYGFYFEQGFPIMGFTPSLYLSMRL